MSATLDFAAYGQTRIIAKMRIELDTASLARLIPLSGGLLEVYETDQLNNWPKQAKMETEGRLWLLLWGHLRPRGEPQRAC